MRSPHEAGAECGSRASEKIPDFAALHPGYACCRTPTLGGLFRGAETRIANLHCNVAVQYTAAIKAGRDRSNRRAS